MIWISGSIIALVLGIIVAALAYGAYAEWQAKRCTHEWDDQFEVSGVLYRGCMVCDRLEKFSPDVGSWTSGHWDEVK